MNKNNLTTKESLYSGSPVLIVLREYSCNFRHLVFANVLRILSEHFHEVAEHLFHKNRLRWGYNFNKRILDPRL